MASKLIHVSGAISYRLDIGTWSIGPPEARPAGGDSATYLFTNSNLNSIIETAIHVAVTSTMATSTAKERTYTSHRSHKCKPKVTLTNTINICTYNTRTLFEEHFDNFMQELVPIDDKPPIKWDIIGLSETKLKDSFNTTTISNHMFFNSGVDISEKRAKGVGFLIHSNLANCVSAFNPQNILTILTLFRFTHHQHHMTTM